MAVDPTIDMNDQEQRRAPRAAIRKLVATLELGAAGRRSRSC
jgi:hypothetical protein